MASPSQAQAPPSAQPPTPTEPSSSNPNNSAAITTSQSQPPPANTTTAANNNASPNATPAATAAATGTATTPQAAQVPSTSLTDSGKSRRPRDVRLIHMLLASLGVTAYQERVPLQLLDFAYRYTSSVLQDAVHLSTEGYAGATDEPGASGSSGRGGGGGGSGGGSSGHDVNTVSLAALRLSIASRVHYQFQTGLSKEFLMDVASERNRVALPGASRGFAENGNNRAPAAAHQSLIMGGMRLPPERFCLTGIGWDMKEEWESEGEEEIDEGGAAAVGVKEEGEGDGEEGGQDDDDEDGKMEDVFGEDTAMGEGGGEGDGDGDKDMADV